MRSVQSPAASGYPRPEVGNGSAHPATRHERMWWLTVGMFGVLFALCALPILRASVPPLLDYPSHLAHAYIVSHPNDAVLATYYAVTWKLIPAIAEDVVLVFLNGFLGIFSAGKIYLLLVILLITSGTFALHYSLYREWTGPALAFLFVFNGILWSGFLPYLFSVGGALWATAGWIALSKRPWSVRLLYSLGAAVGLCLIHPAGIGLYLVAIFCYELARVRWTNRSWRQIGFALGTMVASLLVAVPLMLSSRSGYSTSAIGMTPLSGKWIGPYLAVRSGNPLLDALFVGLLVLSLVLLVLFRRLELPRVACVYAAVAAVTYLLVPEKLFGGTELDTRLPVAFVFFIIGFVRWRIGGRYPSLAFSGVVAIVLAIRVFGVASTWQAYGQMLSDYEASFGQLEPGSRVLVVSDLGSDWQGSGKHVTIGMDRDAIGHMVALAAIERSCLVSDVFADPNADLYSVLSVKAPYRNAIPSEAVDVERLVPPGQNGGTLPANPALDRELEDWPANYDYLYVQYAGPGTRLSVPNVTLLYQGGSFQLYSVQHPEASGRVSWRRGSGGRRRHQRCRGPGSRRCRARSDRGGSAGRRSPA